MFSEHNRIKSEIITISIWKIHKYLEISDTFLHKSNFEEKITRKYKKLFQTEQKFKHK